MRTLTGATGAFLSERLGVGAADFAAAFCLVRTSAALGQLPVDGAGHQVLTHVHAEDGIIEIDVADLLVFEANNVAFHFIIPSPLYQQRRRLRRLLPELLPRVLLLRPGRSQPGLLLRPGPHPLHRAEPPGTAGRQQL